MSDKVPALIIEDDDLWYNHFEKTIGSHEKNFFQFLRAATLAEGLKKIHDGNIQLVLLDLGLPDSQGLDTIKAVLGTVKFVPVIVITSWNDDKMNLDAMSLGVEDYLVKNEYDEKLFFHVVHQAIRRSLNRLSENIQENCGKIHTNLQNIDKTIEAIKFQP